MKFCHCRHLNMQMSSTVGYVLSSIAITNTWVFIIGICAHFLNSSKLTIVTCPWLLWCCRRQCSWFCSMTFLRERTKKENKLNWCGLLRAFFPFRCGTLSNLCQITVIFTIHSHVIHLVAWMNAKAKQVRFVRANSWKLGWQPDSKVKAVVAASAQNEKMERKITSTSAPKARDDCRTSEE